MNYHFEELERRIEVLESQVAALAKNRWEMWSFRKGDKVRFYNKQMMEYKAARLEEAGYKVACEGAEDIRLNVLTITALPEGNN